MSKVLKIKVHNDPGHGWFAVKRKLVNELGIADKITSYSYQRGKTVYLEEDLDAGLLIKALRDKNVMFEIVDLKQRDNSPIRSYDFYKKEQELTTA